MAAWPYFTYDGHVDLDVAAKAITAVADELGVAALPPEAIYRAGAEKNPDRQ